MRIFLTGGSGFVGSHLLREFSEAGYEVTVLARDPSRVPPLPGVLTLAGDIEDFALIADGVKGHDAVVHNALIWPSEDLSELEMRDVRASAHLFVAAASAGVEQILYTSSTAVHRPFRPVMDESSPTDANDFYGATKRSSEAFLSAVSHQYSVRCNVVRPGPVVGAPAFAGGPHKSDRKFAEFVRLARAGAPIHVAAGDGRQFIGVRDLALLFHSVLESDLNREAFVAVSGDSISWGDIAREVVGAVGSCSEVIEDLAPVHSFRFDVGKMERSFGLRFSAADAVREHIAYLVDS